MDDIDSNREVLKHVLQSIKENYLTSEHYKKEFDELKTWSDDLSLCNTREDGWCQYNRSKNRYKDILPYDKSRVRLPIVNSIAGSDYINASHISGPEGYVNYIAAQGPLPNTIFDFWRMIWYNYVTVIVMVCKQIELGKEKCGNYWGKSVGEVQKWGNFSVTLKGEQHEAHHIVRTLQLQCAEVTREVYQYQFLDWPDRDVPTDGEPLYKMLTLVREKCPERTSSSIPDSPIVIHCSAGCGRTGTVLAIDFIGTLIKESKLTKEFSVFEMVKQMRGERVAICQTKQQYGFVYYTAIQLLDTAIQALEQRSDEGSDTIYENLPLAVPPKEIPTGLLPPKPLVKQLSIEKPPRPSKPQKPEKPNLQSEELSTPELSPEASEPVYAQINNFSRTGKLIDLEDNAASEDEPPPLPSSLDLGLKPRVMRIQSPSSPLIGSAPPPKSPNLKRSPPVSSRPDVKLNPPVASKPPPQSACPSRSLIIDQLPASPPTRPSKMPSPFAKRSSAVTAASGSHAAAASVPETVRPPLPPPITSKLVKGQEYDESVTNLETSNVDDDRLYSTIHRGDQIKAAVKVEDNDEGGAYSSIQRGDLIKVKVSEASEGEGSTQLEDEANYSELFIPHSDSVDSHLHTSSGDEEDDDEDHYETIDSIEKDGKSKDKSNSLPAHGKKFGIGGKRLKSKSFGIKGLLANISDSAHEASTNFKNKSNLTSNITRSLTSNSSPTPSVYSDLPEMLYVSEFGKRTGSPMGPREMPDHWIKI